MAWINGQWYDSEARSARIELVKDRAQKLKRLYEQGKASDYHLDLLQQDTDELKRLIRIHKAENDVAYFAYEYLSDLHNPDNDDNIIRHSDDGDPPEDFDAIAPIHREFYDLCDYVDHEKHNARLAIAAARGHNKSGTFSNVFPLHQIAFRKRDFILLISETDGITKKLIKWIANQLKYNDKLREDFGELLSTKHTQNVKDNEDGFITHYSNMLVEASSSGKQLRGARHGAKRPDLVIIDDPSSQNNEGTKESREKLIYWFNSVVIPIGTKSTGIILVGTMVSSTGLLNHVLKRKDFKSSFHSAILNEPERKDLWDKYCEIYSRDDGDDDGGGLDEADEYYEANKDEMEKGVKLAWPWRWTYRDLMHEKVNMGSRAFNSEYRNLAMSEDEQVFIPENFAYYHYEYDTGGRRFIVFKHDGEVLKIPRRELTVTAFWDLAIKDNKRSDYNSVITVGKYEKTGHIFVLDDYTVKDKPHRVINTIIEKIREFKHDSFCVETIAAQHEFYRQLEERLRKEGIYHTKLIDVKKYNRSKNARIEALEPLCHNKTLVFNQRHTMLLDQLTQFPRGDYDDSPDALSGAVENIIKPKRVLMQKPSWL